MKNCLFISLSILCFYCSALAVSGSGFSEQGKLYFLENKGQITDQFLSPRNDIQYKVATNKGLNVFIGNNQIHFQFLNVLDDSKLIDFPNDHNPISKINGYRLDVVLLNANQNPAVETQEAQGYVEHYFTNDLKGVQVHSFNKIVYKEVYPDIDWVFYFKNNQLKHEFVVRKGGNIADIQLQYKGSTGLGIDPNGGLIAQTEMGEIVESPPICFQADGQVVASNYVLKEDVLSYNVAHYVGELTIDPSLDWATYYGGSSFDFLGAVETNGNSVFTAGGSSSISNIATAGAHKSTNIGGISYAILVKMNLDGSRVWATYFGGPGGQNALSIALDNSEAIYISGYTYSKSGLATTGAHQTTFASPGFEADAFLAKFSNEGVLNWATYYGGSREEGEAYVATDLSDNVYLSGYTKSTSGIATTGAHQTTIGAVDFYDAFLVKFNSSGVRQWGTYFGGEWDERGYKCATDKVGNVYITGTTRSTSNIASPLAHKTSFSGGSVGDAYLAKFDNSGSRIWSTYYGGTGGDIGYSVATDDSLNVYFVGSTWSNSDIATAGAHQLSYAGGPYDAFMAKFDKKGVREWGTYYGWIGEENAYDVQVRGMKDVFVSGMTTSNFLIASDSAYQKTFAGEQDAMLLQFNDSGKRIYATYFGGDKLEDGRQISVYGATLYMCGTTVSTSGVATSGAHQTIYGGSAEDGYLAKFIFPLPAAPVSVPERATESFKVFPNPANNFLNIRVANKEDFSVAMMDLFGRTLAKESSANGSIRLSTQNLRDGIYLLNIQTKEGEQLHTKVMVQH